MYLNSIIITGNLTVDPTIRMLQGDKKVASFQIASSRPTKQQNKKQTLFIGVDAWDKLADIASSYLAKGDSVLVRGRLMFNQWQDESGNKKSNYKIIANDIQFINLRSQTAETPAAATSDIPSDTPKDDLPF